VRPIGLPARTDLSHLARECESNYDLARGLYPQPDRCGLIEATEWRPCSSTAVRGIRSQIAAASLKLDLAVDRLDVQARIRSQIAAASLKPAEQIRRPANDPQYPQPDRCGLIEATSIRVRIGMMTPSSIRSQIAAASLKRGAF